MKLDLVPIQPVAQEEELEGLDLRAIRQPDEAEADGPKLDLIPVQSTASEAEGTDSDILGAVKRGIETSVSPFTVDEKEVTTPRTKGEKVAETGAQIATDIGSTVLASVGTGAAVGTLVSPGAGTVAGTLAGVGLGIYRALGYEDLMSRAKGEEFNVARASLNVLTEVNPALRLGGRFTKFLSQGALQAAQTLAYGGDTDDAATSALLGGTLGSLGHRQLRPGELKAAGVTALLVDPTLGPKAMQDVTEHLADDDNRRAIMTGVIEELKRPKTRMHEVLSEPGIFDDLVTGAGIQERAAKMGATDLSELGVDTKMLGDIRTALAKDGITDRTLVGRMAKEQAALMKIEDEASDVARFLVRDPDLTGPELFKAASQELRATGMSLAEAVEAVRFQKALTNATEKAADYAVEVGSGFKDPLKNTVLRTFSDQKYAARLSDNITGLDLEPKFAQVSIAKYKKNQFVYWIASTTNDLLKEAKKVGIDRAKISDMLESGIDKAGATHAPEQVAVIQQFRSLFDAIRERANASGLGIGELDNYVTHTKLDPADMITALKRRVRPYVKPDGAVSGRIFKDKELLGVVQNATGLTIKKRNDVLRLLRELEDPEVLSRGTGFRASAAFSRTEGMPDWVREKDIGKVLMAYGNNLANAIYMDPAIRQLEVRLPALKKLGQKHTAEWLEGQISAISGNKSGFLQFIDNQQVRWKTWIDEHLDTRELSKMEAGSLKAARFLPDLMSWGMSQIYPNYLGFSLKAVTRNLSQPTLVTAGEVGGKDYGYRLAMRATVSTALDRKRGINLQKALEEMGLHPGEHIGEGMNQLHNALEKTMVGGLVRASDGVAKVGMYLYGKTDAINRYITWKMAKQLSQDIMDGMGNAHPTRDQKAALAFLKKMPAGYKNELYRDARNGKSIERGVTEYLLSTTQFDYGPQALSEFGQKYGRFVSMFTKWPAMVGGDLHWLATSKQYSKAFEKYLAPLMALAAVDMWLGDTKGKPRLRAILGDSMKDWSPVKSFKISTPPALETAAHVGKSLMAAVTFDVHGAAKEAGKALEPILPFNSLRLGLRDKVFYNLIENKKAPGFLEAR
jgi:hypothetical protein